MPITPDNPRGYPLVPTGESDITRATNTAIKAISQDMDTAPEALRAESEDCSAVLGAGEFGFIAFNSIVGEVETTKVQAIADLGAERLNLDAADGVFFRSDVNDIDSVFAHISTTGIEFDGLKVLGARGAAITNADGTLADLTTKFNALLGVMRAHGLIA